MKLQPKIARESKIKYKFVPGVFAESWHGTPYIRLRPRRRRICWCFCVRSVLGGQLRVRMHILELCRYKMEQSMPEQWRVQHLD